jgi:hypothetical protein
MWAHRAACRARAACCAAGGARRARLAAGAARPRGAAPSARAAAGAARERHPCGELHTPQTVRATPHVWSSRARRPAATAAADGCHASVHGARQPGRATRGAAPRAHTCAGGREGESGARAEGACCAAPRRARALTAAACARACVPPRAPRQHGRRGRARCCLPPYDKQLDRTHFFATRRPSLSRHNARCMCACALLLLRVARCRRSVGCRSMRPPPTHLSMHATRAAARATSRQRPQPRALPRPPPSRARPHLRPLIAAAQPRAGAARPPNGATAAPPAPAPRAGSHSTSARQRRGQQPLRRWDRCGASCPQRTTTTTQRRAPHARPPPRSPSAVSSSPDPRHHSVASKPPAK